MRKVLAALTGIGAATSLLAISAPRASADTFEAVNCYKYPIGTICVVRGYDDILGSYYFYGEYRNTGASPHTGHIDLYAGSGQWQDSRVTINPGGHSDSFKVLVVPSAKVHASWVDKNGTHFVSPTETEDQGL